eukprot:565473-Pleurochrysis_carterae.AAC.1
MQPVNHVDEPAPSALQTESVKAARSETDSASTLNMQISMSKRMKDKCTAHAPQMQQHAPIEQRGCNKLTAYA